MKKITLKLFVNAFMLIASYQVNAQCSATSAPEPGCEELFAISLNLPENNTQASDGDKYYLRSNLGRPWNSTTNDEAMDLAFGTGNWIEDFFETLDLAAVFSSDTAFVFMDGSDVGPSALGAFLATNITALETWVSNGGSLIINAAPTSGGNIDFGFGGTLLSYDGSEYVNETVEVDAAHPAIAGPNTPTATTMTGNDYSHATITGTDYATIIAGIAPTGGVVLAEKDWGDGLIIVGGMTTVNFHQPVTEGANFRANLFVYADNAILNTEEFQTNDFSVFPNPAASAITIHAQNDIERVVIYNVLGQEVKRQEIGALTSEVNIASLPIGVYFVEATLDGINVVKRIIKR